MNSNLDYNYHRNLAAFGARACVLMLMIMIITNGTTIMIKTEFKFKLHLAQKFRSVWRESVNSDNNNDVHDHKIHNNINKMRTQI